MKVKVCKQCGEEFEASPPQRTICSPTCVAERQKNTNRLSSRKYYRKSYGISDEEWEALFESQGRKCVFGCEEPGWSGHWHTDHDHLTGKVRGILCLKHNRLLGQLESIRDQLPEYFAFIDQHRTET